VDSFLAHSMVLKGSRQVLLTPTVDQGANYVDAESFLLPYPQLLSITENTVSESIPGGDTVAATINSTKSAVFKLRWPRLKLQQLAKMKGSEFIASGDSPNRQLLMKRKIEDVSGTFKIEGRVAYIGSEFPNGDYRLRAFLCSLIGSPAIVHETDKVAIYEADFEAIESVTGDWYEMEANETGTALAEDPDLTVPAVESSVPADNNNTKAIAAANLTVTFDREILFSPKDFMLQHVVSAASVLHIATTNTHAVVANKSVVTMAHPELTNSANYNIAISGAVRTPAGAYIAAPANLQFTTVAP